MNGTEKRVKADQRAIMQVVKKDEYTGYPVVELKRVPKASIKRSLAEIERRQNEHDIARGLLGDVNVQ